uniref:Potassium voltage-gated channel subfamily E member 4 n=1 Tax=Cyanoderma ruficeps TaxID=181631 RepID=A0A8C3NTL1_9PASS
MNQTALASLILQCVLQLLERNLDTRKNATEQKEPQYKPYDNAYFFILFVMLFYSFLALTVFFGYVRSKKAVSKQDPYQEFIEDRNRNKKWNMTRPVVVKLDFEEENLHIYLVQPLPFTINQSIA